MGLGQLRGPSWLADAPRNCPNQISIVAHDGAYVNDFDHGWFVMKNHGNSVPSSSKTPRLTRPEAQVSKSARPFDKLRAGSGAPRDFPHVNV